MAGVGAAAATAVAFKAIFDLATGKNPQEVLRDIFTVAVIGLGVSAAVEGMGGLDSLRAENAPAARAARGFDMAA